MASLTPAAKLLTRMCGSELSRRVMGEAAAEWLGRRVMGEAAAEWLGRRVTSEAAAERLGRRVTSEAAAGCGTRKAADAVRRHRDAGRARR